MNWETAVAVLAGQADGDKDEARGVVHDLVFSACATDAGPEGPNSLGDWIATGHWNGNETLDQIVAEWDEWNVETA